MSLISSPALAAFRSVSHALACAPQPSARSIPIAAPSSPSAGPAFPSTATCASSTAGRIGEQLTLFAGATPASPSAWQDSAVARKMKDISGRRCIALYEKSGRDGSLPKMLLAILASVSTKLPHRWKLKASPSGRLLFQLAPLAPRIDATDFGFWPTPDVRGFTNDGSLMMLKEKCRNREEWAAMAYRAGISQKQKLWPTPHGFSPDGKSNGPSGNELGRAVNQSLRQWPTPTSRDWKDGTAQACKNVPVNGLLGRAVHQWPTPTANRRSGLQTHGSNAILGSLNPTWVEWLQGYPIGWTDCAPSAMPSSRKSRRSSGKPS